MSLKLLGKNTVIYAIGNIGTRAAAFLLIPLYIHALSMADFGLLATLQVTIRIIAVLIGGGMRTALVRFAKEYETKGCLSALLGTSIAVNLLSSVVISAVALWLFRPLFESILHTSDVYAYVALSCGAALAHAMNIHITSYFRARQQAIRFMIVGIATAALLFVLTFLLIYVFPFGVSGALVAFILANAIVFLGVCACVSWKIGMRISGSLMPKLFRFGVPQICSQCTELVVASVGVYLLSYYAGLEAVAVYSLGYKLALILVITTISPFSLAFEPYVFSNRERLDHKTLIARSLTYMVLAVVFVSFGLLVATRILLPKIAPPEYASAFLVVLLLIPGMTFMGVCYFGQTILNAMNRTRVIGIASLITAGFSFVTNFALINYFHWYGAVLSFNASFILFGLILTMIALKRSSITLERRRLIYLVFLFLSLMLTLFALREFPIIRFLVIGLLAVVLGMLLLLQYDFFHKDEKLVVRQLAARFCSKFGGLACRHIA